jgi:hypothetical protein
VEATNYDRDRLRYVIRSIEDAVDTVSGWAEPKRCVECEQPVALLFDDAYLESSEGDGVICANVTVETRIPENPHSVAVAFAR